jgi:decaprenylphospho-beta-D-ribofuranose 2-oxidase
VSPTPAAGMTIRALPVRSCEEAINLLAAHSQDAEVLYSWHNATDIWQQFGKGYVFVGKWIQQLDHQPHHAITHCPELSATNRGCLPFNCWNRFSLSVVNAIHAWQCSRRQGSVTLPLKDALFPIHRKQLYFYLYGRKGFHEYQAIVPRAFASIYCDTIARFARRHSLTVPLLSIKSFCGKNELLRFSGNGMCIAVNLPRSEKALRMLRHLDEQLMQVGGQPNLIKDSRLPRDVVDACYPEADRFRRLLREYDRTRRYQSELSRRLSL